MKKTVLVLGATGNQGGAVLRALLTTDFSVRAFVRNASDVRARRLKEQGVQIAHGDLDSFDSLVQAMNGAYGVFSMVNFADGGVVNVSPVQLTRQAFSILSIPQLVALIAAAAFRTLKVSGGLRNTSAPLRCRIVSCAPQLS